MHVLVSRAARPLLAHASKMSSRLVSPSITTCRRTGLQEPTPTLLSWDGEKGPSRGPLLLRPQVPQGGDSLLRST